MWSRYLTYLEGNVKLFIYPSMASLFERQRVVDSVYQTGMPEHYDYWVPIPDIPHIVGAPEPDGKPYIKPAPICKLNKDMPNVGICWCGNPAYGGDYWRSMPLKELESIVTMSGIRVWSLVPDTRKRQYLDKDKKPIEEKDLADHPQEWQIYSALPFLTDWDRSASLIEQLDAVISVDTAVAHVAGAVGTPVAILANRPSEWRWGDRETTKWYQSAVVYRQHKLGDWSEPVNKAEKWLKKLLKL